jgi:tetratricopeptide repeat protein 21B
MATVCCRQKNFIKLRSVLKRIAKLPYDSQSWKEFERSYLLLAKCYLERGEKLDISLDLCKRCLFHNKRCTKAWDLLGTTMRHKSNDVDAIHCYHQAAKFDNNASVKNLFRLALLYFKSNQFPEAIFVCAEIIKHQPNYPHIANLFENCVLSMRP